MSNSGSEQRDHGTAMGDRDEGGGTSPILHCIHDSCISRGKPVRIDLKIWILKCWNYIVLYLF
ncbi:hypothetical protein ACOSQ4_021734 [Xanthoceras sorbifolium]